MKQRIRPLCLTLAALASLCGTTRGVAQTPQPTAATTAPAFDAGTTLLPELRFDGVALSDVLDFMRDAVPGFQFVLESEEGDKNWPVTMHLKHVTVSQFFGILSEVNPSIKVVPVSGPKGNVWVVHNGAPHAAQDKKQSEPLPPPVRRMYCLTPAIDALMIHGRLNFPQPTTVPTDAAIRAAKLKDVMSLLVQAAESTPTKQAVDFKLHEPTEVLIVTGPQKELDAIAEALAAINPTIQAVQMSR